MEEEYLNKLSCLAQNGYHASQIARIMDSTTQEIISLSKIYYIRLPRKNRKEKQRADILDTYKNITHNMAEIGRRFSLTRERIRQIVEKEMEYENV